MEREKRNNAKQNQNDISKRKWYSVVGLLISITLLSIAIFMSINQENDERLARLNSTDVSSTELTRDLNEVKAEKTKQTLMNLLNDNKVNKIENNIETNGKEMENGTSNVTNSTSENLIETNSNTIENSVDEQKKDENEISNNVEEDSSNTQIKSEFIKPVEGQIINIFSMDRLIYSNTLQEWVTHRGLDIKAEKEAVVKATKSGLIKSIKNDPRYGTSVTIEHDGGFMTVYSCLLSTADLTEGASVEQGQVIGNVGNSGVFEVSDGMHLHFEMLKDGEYVNPDMYIK